MYESTCIFNLFILGIATALASIQDKKVPKRLRMKTLQNKVHFLKV